MDTLLTAPGAGEFALLVAQMADFSLSVAPPDADVQVPLLTTAAGAKVFGAADIARHIAAAAPAGAALYPAADATRVDALLAAAGELAAAAGAWAGPAAAGAGADARAAARATLDARLAELDAALGAAGAGGCLVGAAPTLADAGVACALAGLYRSVLGAAARAEHPRVEAWLRALLTRPEFAAVLGPAEFCTDAGGWVEPAAPAGGKKKKGGGGSAANGAASNGAADGSPAPSASMTADAEADPVKAAKVAERKAAKLAEKEAKKVRADAKAAKTAADAAARAADGGAAAKRASKRAEADAKRAAEAAEAEAWVAAARATPAGARKAVGGEMPKAYAPRAVEAGWYAWWEAAGFFKPASDADPATKKEPFAMVIPPPNVTGSLHIGHALTNAIEDAVARWRRMSGRDVLWLPGTDHAGIATQTVVERKVARERGATRHDLGREAFLEEVWGYVREYGGRICEQQRRLGCSVDWSRYAFTMDEARSAAVRAAFLKLHAKGLVYRDNRLVNWCCRLRTAVSDIEVDYVDVPRRALLSVPGHGGLVEFGVLTSFAYPLEGGAAGEELVVATTRPETMFGDAAVAVHPDDARYKHLVGRRVVHPVNGRLLPIIADAELVDMSFGTGAVKITPAHDPNDFATGKRHGLEFYTILDDEGRINGNGTGAFAGQGRFTARATIVDFLKEKGLFRGTADNPMRLGLCSRSKDVIEPVLKPQWWVACGGMAAEAAAAARDGRLEVLPKEHEATWHRWLEGIRDWCVSRQLWWGHRIPAFYVRLGDEAEGERGAPGAPSERMDRWVVAADEAAARAEAEARFPGRPVELSQDEDVLDTWFSSGLFPFSTMGWPDAASPDLARFFPGALLETGHDILFFWVARMVMLSLTLTGEVPFKQVYLHSMVRDAHGRKMSKSLGNVLDPVAVMEGVTLAQLAAGLEGGNLDAKEVAKARAGQAADFPEGIEECGADALRFALVAYTGQGAGSINLDINRVVAYRHWCNKLWNAIRFAMLNLGTDFIPSERVDAAALPFAARWILSRLSGAAAAAGAAMERYEFSAATTAVYAFWQYDLCDVYIELAKALFADGAEPSAAAGARDALWLCLDAGLRLLHPFMPFVTEELWQRLPRRAGAAAPASIMLADYPARVEAWDDAVLEGEMAFVQAVVGRVRGLRSEYDLTPRHRPPLYLSSRDTGRGAVLAARAAEIAHLAGCAGAEALAAGAAPPRGCGVAVVDEATTAHLGLAGVLDAAKELEKLAKREGEAAARAEALERKAAGADYLAKTPAEVRAADADKLAKARAEVEEVRRHAGEMRALLEG